MKFALGIVAIYSLAVALFLALVPPAVARMSAPHGSHAVWNARTGR